MDPLKPSSLLDPKFRYVSAAATDVRKTFDRIKREQKRAAEAAVKPSAVVKIEQ